MVPGLPPEKLKHSTLRLRIAAIAKAHEVAGFIPPSRHPEVRVAISGAARLNGSAVTKKSAATRDILRDALLAHVVGDTLKAKRDRALLTIGFYAALRRSELVAIDVEHIVEAPEGLILTLPFRKTDQEGKGSQIGLTFKDDPVVCPVRALRDYVAASGITEGALFRSIDHRDTLLDGRLPDRYVARLVKAAARAVGKDAEEFSAHSLRSGFITTAAQLGIADRDIAEVSGHRSMDVLHGYIRRVTVFNKETARV